MASAADFWTVLKKITSTTNKVPSDILNNGSPFAGPPGSCAAALAAAMIALCGQPTEVVPPSSSTPQSKNTISSFHTGIACRGVLSEVALSTVFRMDSRVAEKHGVFEQMEQSYKENKDIIPMLAGLIGPLLLESTARAALRLSSSALKDVPMPTLPDPADIPPAVDACGAQGENWFDMLKSSAEASEPTDDGDETQDRSWLKIVGLACKTAPGLVKAAGQRLTSKADEVNTSSRLASSSLQPHYETVCHRALLGEAALQALQRIPASTIEEEGLLRDIVVQIKSIGSTVLTIAPGVVHNVQLMVEQVRSGCR